MNPRTRPRFLPHRQIRIRRKTSPVARRGKNRVSCRKKKLLPALGAIYLVCATMLGLLTLISGKYHRDSMLNFNGAALPEPSHFARYNSGDNTGESEKKNSWLSRSFHWKDPAGNERQTQFQLDEIQVKEEISRFGQMRGMDDPMLITKSGFKIIGRGGFMIGNTVSERLYTIVDYKKVYERHLAFFPPLTRQFMDSIPDNQWRDPLIPLLTFVQQIPFRRPPDRYKGRFIGSFFVPLVCLYEQYGDCDSKSVLLAEFLGTYPGVEEKTAMVMVYGKGIAHALLGVRRKPLPGMTAMYLERSGYFIVLETTRPGWSPGFIDPRITSALKEGYFRFEILN